MGCRLRRSARSPFESRNIHVDSVVTVSTDEICAAIKDVYDETRAIAEPAGALAIAGLKAWAEASTPAADAHVVAVLSGANVNFDRLRHIAERAEIGEHRELLMGVTIAEEPGSFLRFCRSLGKHSVTEFNYRYADREVAHVYVGLQLGSGEQGSAVVESLRTQGYETIDMTHNEIAKAHVRHMVGGRVNEQMREWLYRFEFPERPGALGRFLSELGVHWNITLFHYRNHGAAWGRVLVGFDAAGRKPPRFESLFEANRLSLLGRDGQPGLRHVPALAEKSSVLPFRELRRQIAFELRVEGEPARLADAIDVEASVQVIELVLNHGGGENPSAACRGNHPLRR